MTTQDLKAQFDLHGRVALVTGASEGIGRGLAIGLAAAGADVLLCSRHPEVLEEVGREVQTRGGRAKVCFVDVTDVNSIRGLRDYAAKQFGKIDVLVNNAGFSITRDAWDLSEEEWDRIVDTGLKGVFFCSQIIGSLMRERRYGKIINLASTMSKSVIVGAAAYASVKAGVSHLTRALAVEWATDGIRVNALAPTSVATPSRAVQTTPESLEQLVQRIPLGRQARVEDVIPAAVFLASAASDFVTGHTLFVDGGFTAKG